MVLVRERRATLHFVFNFFFGVALASPSQQDTQDDARLIEALRERDEAAFVQLVTQYQASMLRLALVYCGSRAVAEEVVQDAWLGVLHGLDRFEGRSSFKTWLFRILVNRARTRAERETRTVPFSSLGALAESDEPAVSPDRFIDPSDPDWPNHWAVPPKSWGSSPEDQLLRRETLDVISRAIAALPPAQREVATLRDVEGWTSEEVCNVLEISETNQRVLLHRARSRIRGALERYLDDD
jgi:RNA polymerase sigma-70 factor, ECF subfamily